MNIIKPSAMSLVIRCVSLSIKIYLHYPTVVAVNPIMAFQLHGLGLYPPPPPDIYTNIPPPSTNTQTISIYPPPVGLPQSNLSTQS